MIAIFPEIVNTAKSRDMELLAIQVRRYFAGEATYQPKLDLEAIIGAVGMKLERMQIEDDAVLCARDKAGSFEVVGIVNEQITDDYQYQFLLAHLLGHFLLHVQTHIAEGDWRTSGLRETISPMHRYSRALESSQNDHQQEKIEQEADEFAAALLLPVGLLRRASEKLKEPQSLASFFGVSESVLRRRMDDLSGVAVEPTSFVDAEKQLQSTVDTEPRARDVLHSSTGKPETVRMPRSFAANNYKSTEVRTEGSGPEPAPQQGKNKKSTNTESESPQAQPEKPRGMDRIRQLAKQLDKTVKP